MRRFFPAFFVPVAIITVFFGVLSTCARAEAYVNTYPFSAMAGRWDMTSGSGTVRINGNIGNLSLTSGSVRISSLSANADDTGGNAGIKLQSQWLLKNGSSSFDYPVGYESTRTFTNTGVNTYSSSYSGGTISGSVVVTLTSATSASVTQTETNSSSTGGYSITLMYNLTKTSDDASDGSGGGGCDAGAFGLFGLMLCGGYLWRRRA